jgi:hypothetical protein
MRLHEFAKTTEARRKQFAPRPIRDHVIIRGGFALEPMLYSQEEAEAKAGERDQVLTIKRAFELYGQDHYMGRDINKLWYIFQSDSK